MASNRLIFEMDSSFCSFRRPPADFSKNNHLPRIKSLDI